MYWKPVWNLLKGQFIEILLVNAQHVKADPGPKTDQKDAEWLADLLLHGLLRGSLIPPLPIRKLRGMKGQIRKYALKSGAELLAAVVCQGNRSGRDGELRDPYRWARSFQTEKAASIALRNILASIDEETYAEPSKQSLANYLDRWLSSAEPNLAPKTFERYKQLVQVNLKRKLGMPNLTKLQPTH